MTMKFSFLERWYERAKDLARHKHAERSLYTVSFLESFLFPIPTSIMLIPMVQAERNKAWRYALFCSLASVFGGIIGYLLGWFAYESIALPLLEKLGKADKIEGFRAMVDQYGALAVFGGGLTPFPYKVISILSGVLKINFAVFLIASLVSRSMQFFLVAGIVWKFGEGAERFLKRHFAKFTIGFFILVALAWALWHFRHGL